MVFAIRAVINSTIPTNMAINFDAREILWNFCFSLLLVSARFQAIAAESLLLELFGYPNCLVSDKPGSAVRKY